MERIKIKKKCIYYELNIRTVNELIKNREQLIKCNYTRFLGHKYCEYIKNKYRELVSLIHRRSLNFSKCFYTDSS